MDLLSALKVLARHWVLMVVVLLATAPAARAVGEEIDPVFETEEKLLFLGPAHTYTPEGRRVDFNPFASNGLAEQLATNTMATVANTPRWEERLESRGVEAKVAYKRVTEVIVEVRVTAESEAEALRSLGIAVHELGVELADRQRLARAPEESWVYLDPLLEPQEATMVLGSRIKATAGMLVLGLFAGTTLVFLAEALGLGGKRPLRRWWRRRRGGFQGWRRALVVAYTRQRRAAGFPWLSRKRRREEGGDGDSEADEVPALTAPWH